MADLPTPEQIQRTRSELLKRLGFDVLHVYDTFEKESGHKDVFLAGNAKEKAIVRVGEARPAGFFPEGYQGKSIRIPKLIEHNLANVPYEVEEYIDGVVLTDKAHVDKDRGEIARETLAIAIGAFWELQSIGRTLPLDQKFTIEKIWKHLEKAKTLLPDEQRIRALIASREAFWNGSYPSKWKFSLDNLMLVDGKVAFIDNINVGLRFLGYDIGWLIWPSWVHLSPEHAENHFDDYLVYLNGIHAMFCNAQPDDLRCDTDVSEAFWLTILERIIGALYDVENETRHLGQAGITRGSMQEKGHVAFLLQLHEYVPRQLI